MLTSPLITQHLHRRLADLVPVLSTSVLQSMAGQLMLERWGNARLEGRLLNEVVSELTGLRPGPQLDEVTARFLFTDIRNHCLTNLWIFGGLNAVRDMIQCPDEARLCEIHRNRQPVIFVFNHIGPPYAVGPAFQKVGIPVAIFQGQLRPPLTQEIVSVFGNQLPGMEYFWVADGSTSRAAYLKRAVDRLKRGELVATAVDAMHGDQLIEVEFCGYKTNVARGPAALARMTGATVIPITLTWGQNWSIEFRLHSPIVVPDSISRSSIEFEVVLTRMVVRQFDAMIRQSPEQLRLDRLARLITNPRAR